MNINDDWDVAANQLSMNTNDVLDTDDLDGSSIEQGLKIAKGLPTLTRLNNEVAIDEESFDTTGSLIGLKRRTVDEIYQSIVNMLAYLDSVFVKELLGQRDSKISEGGSSIDSQIKKKKNCPLTRTGCKALLRTKLNTEGLFEVVNHFQEHNHSFTRLEWSHLHRSERSISSGKGQMIESMVSSGMKPTDFYRYMAHEAGGDQGIGHTKKDHLNYVNRMKMKEREGGDSQKLVDLLYQQQLDEVDFYFRVKLDDTDSLSSIFWRDSMMKEDYEIFGDVVIFDTTHSTNKYELICAPFVGINNHQKNVMFGCAFLSNEKIESFEWLFQIFKKAMGGKSPVTIFTDQDHAIASAIEKVFPGTKHRLCQWHLYQNAISKFGRLKSNKCFQEAFRKCLSGCVDKIEFESCWNNMISEYNLENQPWFQRLYDLKDKWCTTLIKQGLFFCQYTFITKKRGNK